MANKLSGQMVGYAALSALNGELYATGAKIKMSEVLPDEYRVDECSVEISALDLEESIDGLRRRVLQPAIAGMVRRIRVPGRDIVFLKPRLPDFLSLGNWNMVINDETLGVAMRVSGIPVMGKHQDFPCVLLMTVWYTLVARPPYTVTYKLQPADPLDWSPGERGLQRIIEEDLAAGVAVLARSASPLKEDS